MSHTHEVFDQLFDPILIWDFASRRISYVNDAATGVYGYAREEMIGHVGDELLAPAPPWRDYRASLERDGKWTGTLAQRRRDGSVVEVETRMVVVREGDDVSVIETNRPVAGRPRLE